MTGNGSREIWAGLRLSHEEMATLIKVLGVAALISPHFSKAEQSVIKQIGDKAIKAWWEAGPARLDS